MRSHSSGEGPHLAGLLHEPDAGVDEEGDAGHHGREAVLGHLPRLAHGVEHVDGGGQGVGDLLDRGGAGLLQVVAADVHRVPLGDEVAAVGDHVDDQPAARQGREDVGPPREVLLDDVVLGRAPQPAALDALLFGVGHVEGQQPGGRGVDRHRRVHLAGRDPVEQLAHVAEVDDRHADLADLALGQHVVGVVAGLGGQVEGDREAGLAPGQVGPVQLVRGPGGGVAGVGAHQPGGVACGHAASLAVASATVTPRHHASDRGGVRKAGGSGWARASARRAR